MKLAVLLTQDVPPNRRMTIEVENTPEVIVHRFIIYWRAPLTCNPTVYRKASVYYIEESEEDS
jgi:hypothetical protein